MLNIKRSSEMGRLIFKYIIYFIKEIKLLDFVINFELLDKPFIFVFCCQDFSFL